MTRKASIHKLDKLNNMLGPLSKDIHARLRAVLSEPNQATWDNAHCIILRADKGLGLTLWQAVMAVDWSFPHSKPYDAPWPCIPDKAILIKAIEYAQTC